MYNSHFGLTEAPFSLTPDTEFFHELQPHIEALQVLLTALHSGEGFIKVTGEVGTGKTMLCRKLLSEMPEHFQLAYMPTPSLTPIEILGALISELGIDTQHNETKKDQAKLTTQLQQHLLHAAQQGKKVVVLLDEAQALSWDAMETLRLLGNLETEKQKLLHIVLFGQPELNERLQKPEYRQLTQRISFSYKLRSLTLTELSSYISHRLYISGYRGAPLFCASTLAQLHKASMGVPRLINVLCHKCLMLSYGSGERMITPKMMQAAILDTQGAIQPKPWRSWLLPLSGSLILCAAFLILLRNGL